MNLQRYVTELTDLLESHPEYADLILVTSIDDEGNGFNRVFYGPTAGNYCETDRDFTTQTNIENINAICLN